MRNGRYVVAAGWLLGTTFGGPGGLAAQQRERFDLAGERAVIYNLAGTVRVVSGDVPTVTVTVSRQGEDGSRLRVQRDRADGAERLAVIFPGERVVYGDASGRMSIRVLEDGSFGRGGRPVVVAGSGKGLRAHADLTVTVPRGRHVSVHLGVGELRSAGVEADLDLGAHSGSVEVKGHRGRLSIDTGSGSVRAADVRGDLAVDTGSGAVAVESVEGGSVSLDTGSGGVSGTNIRADRLAVDTGSGAVRLSRVRAGDLSVDTGSSGVQLELTDPFRSVTVDTGSGAVTLRLPASVGARFRVETGSGGIHFDVPLDVTRAGRSYLEATLGDGSGLVQIETGAGEVRILGP